MQAPSSTFLATVLHLLTMPTRGCICVSDGDAAVIFLKSIQSLKYNPDVYLQYASVCSECLLVDPIVKVPIKRSCGRLSFAQVSDGQKYSISSLQEKERTKAS